LTNVVPSTSSTIGAMAGAFQWGPADEVIPVGNMPSNKDEHPFGEGWQTWRA